VAGSSTPIFTTRPPLLKVTVVLPLRRLITKEKLLSGAATLR